MARTYKRDSRGRFSGSGAAGGGGKSRPAPRQVQRGVNRLTRDNAGRITSVGGSGATARGGRIRTAAGNLRATQTTKLSGGKASGTVAKPKGLKPAEVKAKPQVSSARQAATDRLKVKTQTRRAMRADRGSVVTPGQRSRLETGKGATMRAGRVDSTLPKSIARTKGNQPAQVAKRVNRKAISAERQLARNLELRRRGLLINQKSDTKTLRSSITLKKAQNYIATGKVTRDNSMAFKRNIQEATTRINEKRAARAAVAKPTTQKQRWAARSEKLNKAAAKNEEKAKRMFDAANTAGNTAFNTQPGRLAGRARMNAQTEQSFKLQEKAAQQRTRASNLERMANTNKGDAAKGRAQKADAVKASHKGLKKGDTIEGTLFGKREVVKVNAKSVTVKGGIKNFTIPWESIKPKK